MLAQLDDSAIERFDRPVRPGEHYPAFHYREHVSCKRLRLGATRKLGFQLLDALANGGDPALKIFRDQLMRGAILGIDFQGKAAEGAAVLAIRPEDSFAIAGQDGKDARDRVVRLRESRIDHHRPERPEVGIQDRPEQGIFAFEEVIETTRVYTGVGQQVGHACAREPPFPEQIARGFNQAVLSCGGGSRRPWHQMYLDFATISGFT